MKNNTPIGIFDSGIGGLTVADAIQKRLPGESLVYFGDTAHLPYGDKSAESIRFYSKRITEFLLERGVKIIVIACNTAASYATDAVVEAAGKVPVVNVIDPVATYTAASYASGRIGVIGTKGTIASRVYPSLIEKYNSNLEVVSQGTALLAPMIEEGFFDNRVSQEIIDSYLQYPDFRDIEALILGCTHYPLIKNQVEKFFNGRVEIIDSASVVARSVESVLEKENLLSQDGSPRHSFFISDFTKSFESSTKIFFGEELNLKEERIWD